MAELMNIIASGRVLEEAFVWLCKRRENYSHNNDVWDYRRQWTEIKPYLQEILQAGEYTFSPLTEIRIQDEAITFWCSQDALVLKAMTIVLGDLPVFKECNSYHLAGHGGAKAAVRDVCCKLIPGSFVMKSDVKSYYASINHKILFNLLGQHISDKFVLRLLWQFMKRTKNYGELYREVEQGISFRCPLSPLMGALYLKPLDDMMRDVGLFYARYMDDWLIIAPSRWQLRKVVKQVNTILSSLEVEKHPGKTFIGRAEKGFDFLGYFLQPGVLRVAAQTIAKCRKNITRLYEQGADRVRIGEYVVRWRRWARSGVYGFLGFHWILAFRDGSGRLT